MLEDLLKEFTSKFDSPSVAFRKYLEFLSTEARARMFFEMRHKFEWLFQDRDFSKRVMDIHDGELLRSDYTDHIGEIYREHLKKHNPIELQRYNLPDAKVTEKFAKSLVEETKERKWIFVPYTGTGRLIMAIQKRAPNALLFGSENHLDVYRIAFTNVCIHNLNANLLYANPDIHELDISTHAGRKNWELANSWYDLSSKLIEKRRPVPA